MPDAKQTAGLAPRGADAVPGVARLVPLAIGFYGVLFGAAAGWRLWVDGAWPWRAGADEPGWPLTTRVAAGLAFGSTLIAASRLWTSRSEAGRRLAAELAALLGPLTTAQAVLLAAVSGVAEESFFRGALQPRVGWLAASLLFGLAHFHPRKDLRVWSLTAALAGLGLGALFAASGDLVAPITAHILINAVNLHWLGNREPH